MNKNSKSNHVILCDSTSKLDEINQIINKYDAHIIVFDNVSHNFLFEKKNSHLYQIFRKNIYNEII